MACKDRPAFDVVTLEVRKLALSIRVSAEWLAEMEASAEFWDRVAAHESECVRKMSEDLGREIMGE